MRSIQLKNKIGAAILGFVVILGVGATAGTVSAQSRYGQDSGYGRGNRYNNDVRRIAEDQGFKDGIWEGSNRALARRSFDPYNTNSYKKATDGYNKSMGDKYFYQEAYRQGYLRGYEQGFRRDSGYGRGGRRPY